MRISDWSSDVCSSDLGAAGLRIGTAVVFPGASGRLEAAAAAGRIAGTVMVGVLVMLPAAGLLEGFGRQLITDTLARYGIGTLMLFFWLCYYYLPHQWRGPVPPPPPSPAWPSSTRRTSASSAPR